MSILTVHNVGKFFGAANIFSGISFNVARGERVAIVGVNGAGKSTLLRIIANEEAASSGSISTARSIRMSYLAQEARFDDAQTLRGLLDEALVALHERGVPIGVVSNASGQIEDILSRSGVCQVGPGRGAPMRCIIDSHVVGVSKPDPAIFDHALPHFADVERSRIAYVGDSLVMDVEGSRAAGLLPYLMDPYGDMPDAPATRISSLLQLL